MNRLVVIQSQLLATKLFVPTTSRQIISRPRLMALLYNSLKYPLTLVSTPAGFGKTILLSSWVQSLPANNPVIAWVSLDEEDNDPQLFWSYILSALSIQQPERFTSLFKYLQSSQPPPLKYILTALSNLLLGSEEHVVLILDDYHRITEQEVHNSLYYLVEHLPAQLHIIVATRTDPPLPLSQLRAYRQLLEVRTNQLRCTTEEAGVFFQEIMGIQYPDETIQEVTARTEGWLVGLQLLSLSLPEHADPLKLLEEASGDQRYILDYLTEEVLRRQAQDVQMFLLVTSILERLTASLCDAVMQQSGSQWMLEQLEQANLFIVSLDSKRQWYRYHALFAEALQCQLEQTHRDLVLNLHHRASLWYAQHGQTTQAITHAIHAQQWPWAADLIEQLPVQSFFWVSGAYELVLLRRWLEQLPTNIVSSRPRLCLICSQVFSMVVSPTTLQAWLSTAEEMLTASLAKPMYTPSFQIDLSANMQQEQKNLLGEIIAWRTFHCCLEGHHVPISLYQQAFSLLSSDNYIIRAFTGILLAIAYYTSDANDAKAAIKAGLQAASCALAARQPACSIDIMCKTAFHLLGTGQLHEAEHLIQQAKQLGMQLGGSALLELGWPAIYQAELLREWNDLNAACILIGEAIEQCKQTELIASPVALTHLAFAYAVALRIYLSRGDYNAACSALQEFEQLGMTMNRRDYLFLHAFLTTIDQIRLWLACGELERASSWAKKLDEGERKRGSFVCEREEVAYARVLLAKQQTAQARERLESALQRATAGQRWGHVIEIRILQSLAYQMQGEQTLALDMLALAIRLAEPEGYIRSFVDEGAPMATLLSRLQVQRRTFELTPYLDTLLAAFSS